MWIKRDIEQNWDVRSGMPVRILRGVRQSGKSSLLRRLAGGDSKFLSLDDLGNRQLANTEPKLFLQQSAKTVIIDEVQYAPNLFPELKRIVDEWRHTDREQVAPSFWLTGSNQTILNRSVKESLAGRATWLTMHNLSAREINQSEGFNINFSQKDIFLRGGWPELYIDPSQNPKSYLNDYIQTVVEKDIAQSAGIRKLSEFERVLALLAARTGQIYNGSNIANEANVELSTVNDWVGLLEYNHFCRLLRPYHSNLSKRLIKSPKLYFLDVGIAARLQGWSDVDQMLISPQVGGLFETLVFGELIRTRDHLNLEFEVFFVRNKEKEEVDFVIENKKGEVLLFEAKFSSQTVPNWNPPKDISKLFSRVIDSAIVTFGGDSQFCDGKTSVVPISKLAEYLVRKLEDG